MPLMIFCHFLSLLEEVISAAEDRLTLFAEMGCDVMVLAEVAASVHGLGGTVDRASRPGPVTSPWAFARGRDSGPSPLGRANPRGSRS